MQEHVDEIARIFANGAHAVLIMDRAALQATSKLVMPTNITPILLPSRAPELNPVENIWQDIWANWLSNRVFENYDTMTEAICKAWNNLIGIPEIIKSIGMRKWAVWVNPNSRWHKVFCGEKHNFLYELQKFRAISYYV